jgi:hypothetical protein
MSRPAGNRLMLLLAVAGILAIVVIPFALKEDDGDSPVLRTGKETVAVTEPSTESGALVVVGQQRADVDGDGRADEVGLYQDPTALGEEEPAHGLVKVTLDDGATSIAAVPTGYFHGLRPALDINGDGHEQVLMNHTGGGDSSQLLVYAWHDDSLGRLGADRAAPLGLELDGEGRVVDTYVQGGQLLSWLRKDQVSPDTGPVYNVDLWSWSVEGDRLQATPAGHGCVDLTTDDPPQPCG